MDDDYRVCSVCSALLTDDEVWADGSGSVVYTTSSLQTSLEGRVYPLGIGSKPIAIGLAIAGQAPTVDVSMNGVLCEHCYVLQETTEFSGSYDFSDADELDPWAMFDE
jgi:hypothetical protein